MSLRSICLLGMIFVTLAALSSATPPTPPNYQISTPSNQLQNEEQVWFCPTDSNILIANWRDFRLGYRQIGMGRSTDGGNFWLDYMLFSAYQKFDWQSDPTLTVDADGNLLYVLPGLQINCIQ